MRYTLWTLSKVFRFCFKYLFGLIFVFIISSLISVGVNGLNKVVIDELMLSIKIQEISKMLIAILFIYLFIWFLSNYFGYLEAFANNMFRLKVDVFMQKLFMKKSVDTKQEQFYDSEFMDKYTFVSNNTYMASVFIFKIITILFSNFAIIASSIAIYAFYEPVLIFYTILIFILQSLNTIISSSKRYQLSKSQTKEERLAHYLSDLFVNKSTAKEMRIFNFSKSIFSMWCKNNDKYMNKRIKADNKQITYNSLVGIINFIIKYGSLLILLFSVRQGKYGIGTFVMLFGLVDTSYRSIQSLASNVFSGMFNEGKYFKDYYDIVAPMTNEEIKEALQRKTNTNNHLHLGDFQELKLNNISFRYPNTDKDVLNNIYLSISKGEIVSILGYNGSGKTTLSKIMYGGFTPRTGSVILNGKPVNSEAKKKIFKYYGIGPQEYSKFSLSIRDNIGLGCIEKMNDEEELDLAYSKASLYDLINQYPKKDLTIIGKEYDSEAVEISGGERQRVVIASAYMGTPEILVLDEPTASIDPLREFEMLKDFRNILQGRTAILISHRIGFARLADRIILMREGSIVEEGTHDELLKKKGYYAEIFYKQKSLYE